MHLAEHHRDSGGARSPCAAATALPLQQDRFRRAALAWAIMLTLGLGGGFAASSDAQTADPGAATLEQPAGPPSFANVVERVTPAVVNVTVEEKPVERMSMNGHPLPDGLPEDSPLRHFFEQFGEQFGAVPDVPMPHEREGEGSGFIIDPAGYIVTNNHVIEAADSIEITLNDGRQYPAHVVGRDPKTDLALLKVDGAPPLPHVELGDSHDARVGDWVLAVGNPFGLGGSVNAGIISARGRDINSGPYDDYLQIDAPINRGNSGGPLFDTRGRVIGVNTAIFSPSGGNIGIGFAIPAETAAGIVKELRQTGHVERGWLGVQIQPVSEEVAGSLGLKSDNGVLVADVLPNSPAMAAGVKSGDVIIKAAGKQMTEYRDLTKLIAGINAGTKIKLEVIRGGKTRTLDVTIGSMPQDDLAMTQPGEAAEAAGSRIGLFLAPLTPEIRQERGLAADAPGVLVAQVEAGSPAQRAGIKAGSLISMVGQEPVKSPDDVARAVREAADQDRPSVLLRVEQDGEQRFVAVPFA
ncbi:MAG: DegQ family serine endoprotease [Thiohalocapsa sp.]|jgi:serine protease Do|uniref:DegQ family serine endoprotease n=1 Tax=Thiohalocapsa sp. TaxID=2497641 RepID=UPI0025F1494D|nr:DegQ family serine endoprotease [Thiohalocapsa sp.]MCG6940609.1 DegQ family serine endoprotease [Thiohalocapsa sp.]